MTRILPALAALVVLLAPAAAGAVEPTFYVAPNGSSDAAAPCTRPDPCSLFQGLERANLEGVPAIVVALDTGAPFTGSEVVGTDVLLTGEPGKRPRINAGDGNFVLRVRGRAERLELVSPHGNGALLLTGTATDVIVRNTRDEGAVGVVLESSAARLRDSLVVVNGPAGVGVLVMPTGQGGKGKAAPRAATDVVPAAAVVGSTVYAAGEGARGVETLAFGFQGCGGETNTNQCEVQAQACKPEERSVAALDLTNSIVRGQGRDVSAQEIGDTTCAESVVRASHSNFTPPPPNDGQGSVILLENNQVTTQQTETLKLLDVDDALFHLKPGSVARDAGKLLAGPAGQDFEGDSRAIGGRPDIGWDELKALPGPTATTLAATALTQTTVTLNGTVTAGPSAGVARFELTGPDGVVRLFDGGAVPADGAGATAVTAAATGLAAATRYVFRVVSDGPSGTASGALLDFTTPAAVIQQAVEPPLLIACSRELDLVDVSPVKGGKVRVAGLAKRSYAGRTVAIAAVKPKAVAATAVVGPDGAFSAVFKAPRRSGPTTRYVASIGTAKSRELKLQRVLVISSLKPAPGGLRLEARIVGAPKGTKVTIQRIVSCTENRAFASAATTKGRLSIVLPLPEGDGLAFYRIKTTVPRGRRAKQFDTFSLPIVVRRP